MSLPTASRPPLAAALLVLVGCGHDVPPAPSAPPSAPAAVTVSGASTTTVALGATRARRAEEGVGDEGAGDGGFAPSLRAILSGVPVSSAQRTAFQTPIAAANGAVYVAQIEPGAGGDGPGVALDTVVRRGVPEGDGRWRWEANVIEGRTVHDVWHTPPSIGVDRAGRVHVAYNMHNFPWQYAVGTAPDSIAGFEFRGEPIDEADLRRHAVENRTDFDAPGRAAIPGTQVTYPAFHRDRGGDLYVSYRSAARPARPFPDRAMSATAARLDVGSGTWSALGAAFANEPGDLVPDDGSSPAPVTVLGGRAGWTGYAPSLEFDAGNRVHALLFWREGVAGAGIGRPCVIVGEPSGEFRTIGGEAVRMPIGPGECPGGGLDDGRDYTTTSDTAMDGSGRFHALLSPVGGGRYVTWYENGEWRRVDSPGAAVEIFFDADDALWAVGTGPVVYRRAPGADAFERVADASGDRQCSPRAALSEDRRRAWIHTRGCEADRAAVYELALLP